MKKILSSVLISLLLVIGFSELLHAQVQKGDNNIGFSSSISTQSASPSSINVTVLLSYERYFSERFALGIGPSLSIITAKGSLTGVFGGNIFANYGFITGNGKFYPYVGGLFSLNYSISTQDTKFETSSTGSTVESGNSTVAFYGVGAKVGSKYFITERINLDLNVNYSANLSSTINGEAIDIGEGGIIQMFLGIGVIIGKKGN